MFTLIVRIADVGTVLDSTFKVENTSDSSDHVVEIADRLGCLGWGVPIGRKNPRLRKIVKMPDSYDS